MDDCNCVCNHSGACTGCGLCLLVAYNQISDLPPPIGAGKP